MSPREAIWRGWFCSEAKAFQQIVEMLQAQLTGEEYFHIFRESLVWSNNSCVLIVSGSIG